ncbi:chemotaxis protein CheV [Legionella rowbothamii]|uniref:chemotaxis protein CheV n=1 Tax=Legionella rowbothamii TaxID=96229 RepID=UPI001056262D|nr:response regulator [Legionella rowbothamii]
MMAVQEHSTENENFLMVPCLIIADSQAMLVGINAQKIIGVVDYERISCLPASHLPFIGLYEHHQEAVPVMDLSLVLKQPDMHFSQLAPSSPTNSLLDSEFAKHVEQIKRYNQTKIIICQLLNMVVGILVHATYRIESLKNSQILSVPSILENSAFCMLNGLFPYKNQFLYLLDLEGILAHLGLLNLPNNETISASSSSSSMAGKTALVVDDAKIFRYQVSKLLSAQGMHCIEAVDGQDGYEKFMQQPDKFDLIFTDFEMPRMGGLEMARKIRGEASTIPVIFNSSISNPTLIAEVAAEYGCFLVKFQPEEIIKKLHELFGGAH